MWWLRLRDLLAQGGTSREPRTSGRGTAKGGTSVEIPVSERPWYLLPLMGGIILTLHLVLFPPIPRLGFDLPRLGEIAQREIRAPFTFEAPILEHEIQIQRMNRVVAEPPVLREIGGVGTQSADARLEIWLGALREQLADTTRNLADRVSLLNLQFPTTDPGELRLLLRSREPDSLVVRLELVWHRVRSHGVADMLPTGKYDKVAILTAEGEALQDSDWIITQSKLEEFLTGDLLAAGMPPREAVQAASVMRHFIPPNLVYSPDDTRQRQAAAQQAVPTSREFIRGERIVDQGVRVTEQQALYLETLAGLVRARGGADDFWHKLARMAMRSLMVIMALALFGWLARVHFFQVTRRLRHLVALTVILAVFLVGSRFALDNPDLGAMAVPVALLSLLATVLFRETIGFAMTLLAILLLAVLPDNGAAHVFVWTILGVVTVVSVRRIQKRSQFYQTIMLLTVLSLVLIFLLRSSDLSRAEGVSTVYLVGFFAPVLSVAFGLFLLPMIEPLVGVCSGLTLLELSDLNHPLLQRMALQAQGTYHHSQVVSQLAEQAARAINANALLTRVGALFHDIGKLLKPEYYVENQLSDLNKHDELSPSMSALVISSHVKEGMELGRRWRLPQAVLDFIPEHHGTMVMEYFYHKALEGDGNETVKVDDFRYPGPKPRSRETAILMLADAVEAATRSLAKPTPSRIKEMTKQIVDKRMLSGELDDSGLTLSDIARIREAFIPLLTGIHHARIVYPGQKDAEEEKNLERRGERKTQS